MQAMKEKHFDRYNIDYAIFTGDEALEASTLANPYYAAALVRAYNYWMVDYWLPKNICLPASRRGALRSTAVRHHAGDAAL
jgi:hypothetical protein